MMDINKFDIVNVEEKENPITGELTELRFDILYQGRVVGRYFESDTGSGVAYENDGGTILRPVVDTFNSISALGEAFMSGHHNNVDEEEDDFDLSEVNWKEVGEELSDDLNRIRDKFFKYLSMHYNINISTRRSRIMSLNATDKLRCGSMMVINLKELRMIIYFNMIVRDWQSKYPIYVLMNMDNNNIYQWKEDEFKKFMRSVNKKILQLDKYPGYLDDIRNRFNSELEI